MGGGHTGLISFRRQRHVENSVVGIKLCLYAQGNIGAMKQDLGHKLGVLHCVHVKEIVTIKLMHELIYLSELLK